MRRHFTVRSIQQLIDHKTQITLDKTSALSVTFLYSCCSDPWTCVFCSSSV